MYVLESLNPNLNLLQYVNNLLDTKPKTFKDFSQMGEGYTCTLESYNLNRGFHKKKEKI